MDVIFKNHRTSKFQKNTVQIRKNFCGKGLWSLSSRHPARTFVEDNPFKSIDQNAANLFSKINRGEKIFDDDLEHLAVFLNSIYYRQPEVIGKMRGVTEEGLIELDADETLSALVRMSHPGIERNRNLAFVDGLHWSDHSIQLWLESIGDQDILDDILSSEFHLLRTPQNSPIPLSDRPYVTVTLGEERFRLFPTSPHTLIVLRKKSPDQRLRILNTEGIYSEYVKHSISAAKRGVVVSCHRSYWKVLEWFHPKDLWLRDFGPGTTNEQGTQYLYGERYAASQ